MYTHWGFEEKAIDVSWDAWQDFEKLSSVWTRNIKINTDIYTENWLNNWMKTIVEWIFFGKLNTDFSIPLNDVLLILFF